MRLRILVPSAVAAALIAALTVVATAGADHPGMGGTPFFATLTGPAEVPGPGHPTATGTASLRLNSGQEEICGRITATGLTSPTTGTPLTITGAHIHPGRAGEFGGILIHLSELVNHPTGTCMPASREFIKAIRKNPENYYVNVHAVPGFGPGAIRGQLQKGHG